MKASNNNWNNYYVSYSTPIITGGSVSSASCYYTADGAINATVTGGTPPYQYQWAGTNQTTANITGLSTGNYYLHVTDAVGCMQYHSFYVGYNGFANCTGKIKGYVYADLNLNCIQDAGENGVAGVQVYCNPFGGSTFTNAQGYYEFTVPVGSYQVQHFPLAYYSQNCPVGVQTVNVVAAGMTVWTNFGEEVIPAQDLQINVYNNMPMVPGGTFQQVVQMKNVGTVAVNFPLLNAYTDPAVTLNVPAGFNIVGPNYYTSSYAVLNPSQTLNQYLTYNVPLTTPLGSVLLFQDVIDPSTTASGELTPWDNTDYYNAPVVGSYDPNYKEVFPKGKGDQGFIYKEDSILEYVIHFQNTGNYPATTVVLKDTLDSDLDWTTVSMGYSTHAYTAKITMDNILEITFDNINLADSFSNVQESMGMVAFKIKQKKGLPVGTKFTNAADIYFDFNYPIHTNTVLNTLMASSTSNVTGELEKTLSLKVYPNPTADKLTVEAPSEWQGKALTVRCLDIMGKEMRVKVEANQEKMSLDTATLPAGWYMLQVSDGKMLLTQKFGVVK